jgi:hypothetical protein
MFKAYGYYKPIKETFKEKTRIYCTIAYILNIYMIAVLHFLGSILFYPYMETI